MRLFTTRPHQPVGPFCIMYLLEIQDGHKDAPKPVFIKLLNENTVNKWIGNAVNITDAVTAMYVLVCVKKESFKRGVVS